MHVPSQCMGWGIIVSSYHPKVRPARGHHCAKRAEEQENTDSVGAEMLWLQWD